MLVVEDEPLVRMVAAEGLFDAGFEVIEAESADDALTILAGRNDVGVLFTDINMPGSVDGAELARLVHERWPALRIVVTSGRDLSRDGMLPADGRFLAKPYHPGELARVIAQMVSAA